MTRKETFAYDLANLCCNPVGKIEIGGLSETLIGILGHQAKKNDKLKEKVFEWIDALVENDYYDKKMFGHDKETAIQDVREDYETLFYNSKY